ncbi:MAG: hypothetical protein WC632_07970 [Candidatus Margulisiibacteriota bacterium]
MEILGLIDTLESMILDSTRVPFTKKLLVDEEKVLKLIDKIRIVVQGGGGVVRTAIGGKGEGPAHHDAEPKAEPTESDRRTQSESKAVEVIEQAYQMAKEIREGADKYADEVLANLESTSTRVLRTVKAGRDRLSKTTQAGKQQ